MKLLLEFDLDNEFQEPYDQMNQKEKEVFIQEITDELYKFLARDLRLVSNLTITNMEEVVDPNEI